VDIAVVRLPHVANFDEFGPLSMEPGVQVRYVTCPEELRAPDLVILPGTKATIPDLEWLSERGLVERIRWLLAHDTPLLGICGGYQMLGRSISDPSGLESQQSSRQGVGLFEFDTVLAPEKRLSRTAGCVLDGLPGIWRSLAGCRVAGYEIHAGQTDASGCRALVDLGGRVDGAVTPDGRVAGTYLHGVLEQQDVRHRLVEALAARRGFRWSGMGGPTVDGYEVLADTLEGCLQLERLPSLVGRLHA
jgi:adenosylcobyric acid synthase